MSDNNQETQTQPEEQSLAEKMRQFLESSYVTAESIQKAEDYSSVLEVLGEEAFKLASDLGQVPHAARGVALTLCAYKNIAVAQDIRSHKSDHPGGFSGRTFDTTVTVPFLQSHGLYYNVETHWLSQTFSFAGPYERGITLKTAPKKAGPLMVELVNRVQEAADPVAVSQAVVTVLLAKLIDERNKGKVGLEKPKELPIDLVIELLSRHFQTPYSKNAPRLPQIAIYAIYTCIVPAMERYAGLTLQPLERMKTANRKSGSVGDVDVNRGKIPVEAVEVKLGIPISAGEVLEAIEKIRSESVSRYLILSTAGIAEADAEKIRTIQYDFRRSNGCEIIVNGVLDTIKYYLRLIRSTSDFIYAYTTIVETDPDVGYEHRQAWNDVCRAVLG